jgi:hypothetical protein
MMKFLKSADRSHWRRIGSLARDTKGDGGPHWEASGLQRNVGLTRD